MTTRTRGRSRLARKLSWLAVASLTSAALFAPGTAAVKAASVAPIFLPADIDGDGKADQNPTCSDLDGLYGGSQTWAELEKIDGSPANGTYGEITITNASGQTFSWTSTVGVDAVLVKAGSDNHALYVYAPTSASAESFGDSGLTHGPNQQGTSHVSFCYDTTNPAPTATPTVAPTATPTVAPTATPTVAPTATPTVAPTATPTVAPTATPTVAPTATPTVAPTATPTVAPTATPTVAPTPTPAPTATVAPTEAPTATPAPTATVAPTEAPTPAPTGDVGGATGTPSPTGEVGGATGTPSVTLPPTDTLGSGTAAPSGDSWRIILLAMAGLLAAALLLTPATTVTAKKDRR